MNDVAGMVVNWMTAGRTIRAVESIRQYYPDMPLYIVDDGSDKKDTPEFWQIYGKDEFQPKTIYDPDVTKLEGLENTTLIRQNHHLRHGEAIDYAISTLKNTRKWILHLDSDARLIKPGVIEYMLDGVDEKTCQIGLSKNQNPDYPHIANYCMMFRADLGWEYAASFKPIYKLGLEAGTRYGKTLMEHGYTLVYKDGLIDYFIHLRWSPLTKRLWNQYY